MTITRDVIIDLLPLYLAGEASEDTRQLVEAYLATDPSLIKLTEQAQESLTIEDIPYTLNKEKEMKSLDKVKKYMKQRNSFMAMAFLSTGLLLAFRFEGTDVSWFWNETPNAAFPIFALALFGWMGYAHAVWKLKK